MSCFLGSLCKNSKGQKAITNIGVTKSIIGKNKHNQFSKVAI